MKLENILNSFTKRIDGMSYLLYWDHLKILGISSLGKRFQRYKCFYTWKIINGHAQNCGLEWVWSKKITFYAKLEKFENIARHKGLTLNNG